MQQVADGSHAWLGLGFFDLDFGLGLRSLAYFSNSYSKSQKMVFRRGPTVVPWLLCTVSSINGNRPCVSR